MIVLDAKREPESGVVSRADIVHATGNEHFAANEDVGVSKGLLGLLQIGRCSMDRNPVATMVGRPLRLAVVGGGPGSFIGRTHRAAATMDGRYEIVAGVVSSDPERSRHASAEIGIESSRAYEDVIEMLDAESTRPDPAPVSGRQEDLENLINRTIWRTT